jgi:hypothetical protein
MPATVKRSDHKSGHGHHLHHLQPRSLVASAWSGGHVRCCDNGAAYAVSYNIVSHSCGIPHVSRLLLLLAWVVVVGTGSALLFLRGPSWILPTRDRQGPSCCFWRKRCERHSSFVRRSWNASCRRVRIPATLIEVEETALTARFSMLRNQRLGRCSGHLGEEDVSRS